MDIMETIIGNFKEQAANDARLVRVGVISAERRFTPALRNLAACYRKAQKDGETKLPSYLHAAITNCAELAKDD